MISGPKQHWSLLRVDPLCSSPYLRVDKETVATPTRPDGVDWFVVHRSVAAVIAPRMQDGRFLIVCQERPAIRMCTWEFPAGQIDAQASPEEALGTARRELREEAGLDCGGEFLPLGFFYSSVGFTDEHAHIFLATDCFPHVDGDSPDEHEAISGIRIVTAEELRKKIAIGEIFDANTLAAFARMVALGHL